MNKLLLNLKVAGVKLICIWCYDGEREIEKSLVDCYTERQMQMRLVCRSVTLDIPERKLFSWYVIALWALKLEGFLGCIKPWLPGWSCRLSRKKTLVGWLS